MNCPSCGSPLRERLHWLLHTARSLGVEIESIRVNGDELRACVDEALSNCGQYNPHVGGTIKFRGCTLIDDMSIRRLS
jgi:hypothetical protein